MSPPTATATECIGNGVRCATVKTYDAGKYLTCLAVREETSRDGHDDHTATDGNYIIVITLRISQRPGALRSSALPRRIICYNA